MLSIMYISSIVFPDSGEVSLEALVMQFLYKDFIPSAEGASLLGGSGGMPPRENFETKTPENAVCSNLSIKLHGIA